MACHCFAATNLCLPLSIEEACRIRICMRCCVPCAPPAAALHDVFSCRRTRTPRTTGAEAFHGQRRSGCYAAPAFCTGPHAPQKDCTQHLKSFLQNAFRHGRCLWRAISCGPLAAHVAALCRGIWLLAKILYRRKLRGSATRLRRRHCAQRRAHASRTPSFQNKHCLRVNYVNIFGYLKRGKT